MYRNMLAAPVVNLSPTCGVRGKAIKAADIANDGAQDVYAFLGVPYAEPPVGARRFKDPQPITFWDGIRDATEYGAACPQDFSLLEVFPFHVPRPASVSEDCLFLNIWTTSVSSSSRLPVMLWIHGGGLNSGYSDLNQGQRLSATKNVVIVTFNYRIGAFGFLCTNDSAAAGNYGIMDQIEALKWVKQHIVHFGGDPDNVTIFGESAGGMSVSLLVVSPLTKGLFRRAIAQSGNVFSGDVISCPPEKAATTLRAYIAQKFPELPATASGSEIVDFLHRQSTEDLVALGVGFSAVIDGRVLPKNPSEIYNDSEQNHVDLMIGCNSDEGVLILDGLVSRFGMKLDQLDITTTRFLMTSFMSGYFTFTNAEQVAEMAINEYMNEISATPSVVELRKILSEFLGDLLFVITTLKTANYHSRVSKTFLYYFCHRPAYAWYPEWAIADHGTEVSFVMDLNFDYKVSDEDRQLSKQMMSYWVNFARTGNPNGEGLVEWPVYNETSKEHIVLQLPVTVGSRLKEKRADLWLRRVPEMIAEHSQKKA